MNYLPPGQSSLAEREAWLAETGLLRGLPRALTAFVANHVHERRLPNKAILYLQQDPSDFIAFVAGGTVYGLLYGAEGRELIVSGNGPGDIVGETALLGDHPRQTTASASGETRLFVLQRNNFGVLLGDAQFLQRVLELSAARLGEATALIETMCLYSLESRLARLLLRLFERDRHRNKGSRIVSIPANQSLLASMINASRPKLNATLQDWKRLGLIHIQPGSLQILDLPQIRRKADAGCETRWACHPGNSLTA